MARVEGAPAAAEVIEPALVAPLAKSQHQSVLAQAHRLAVAIAGEAPDLKEGHVDRASPRPFNPGHRLLGTGDPEPAIVRRAGADAPFLFICDHAGRLTPARLGDMGLPAAAWERHIAWDIGAAALTSALGEAFDACSVEQRYSRLVIDCNRDPARADAIAAVSDGQPVPANAGPSETERAARVAEVHAPYHAAIAAELDARAARGLSTLLVCVHSFTPRLETTGHDRPWSYGVLHDGGSPASHALLAALRGEPGVEVGDNEPYAMALIDYSAPLHAIARGGDYVEIEVRQDLVADAQGVAQVAQVLARRLPAALAASSPRGG